jgi:hypothetical protein
MVIEPIFIALVLVAVFAALVRAEHTDINR